MTESLFDTNFTSEHTMNAPTGIQNNVNAHFESDGTGNQGNQSGLVSPLPSVDDNTRASALLNFRVLVSAKEAGCLIGQGGSVIDSIREKTNTKAGISKLQPGTNERILTVSGTLDDATKALSYFAQALCNASFTNKVNYQFFPLKQLSNTPCIDGETTILRLLIPNSQMGTLIGSKGVRIQQIQAKYNVSMIASKSFLPGSNERLVELQGSVDNLYDALRVIARCLIEVFSSIVGTNYYVPKSRKSQRRTSQNMNSTTLSFSNDIIGALIGRNGSRIQGVRKVSGAIIAISDDIEGNTERILTITGSPRSVEKAKSLLYHNLEREEKRRIESAKAAQIN